MAAWETAKNTPLFTTAVKALGADLHRLLQRGGAEALAAAHRLAPFRRFVLANQEPLRRIAASTTQPRWMTDYIDYIVRFRPAADVRSQPPDASQVTIPGSASREDGPRHRFRRRANTARDSGKMDD